VQQPPAYPPQQPVPYAVVRPTNSLAVVSFVVGIASYVALPLVGGIVAIVLGHLARGQIRRTGESGSGFALAGLILGYVNVVLTVIAFAALAIVVAIAGYSFFTARQA
jgi:hypothetical protein